MWNKLYDAAVKVQNGRTISPFTDAGGVAAAILTKRGDIEILLDLETKKTVKLKELIPDWWGYSRFEE